MAGRKEEKTGYSLETGHHAEERKEERERNRGK